ncbi:MAG: sigma-54 dependent transcriptional regulator [Deltaproteobacteria bacterium]|nr:sigma-54 dependent transcriptional regulator [Deltaproteobacteria bacterium]
MEQSRPRLLVQSQTSRILIIDDDFAMQDACREVLVRQGYETEVAATGSEGLAALDRFSYDVVLLDLRMPDIDGMSILHHIVREDSLAVVIVISGHGSIETAVEAMKAGAFDFLAKPFTPVQLREVVHRACEKRELMLENAYLKEELRRRSPSRLIHQSTAMNQVMELSRRVAPTDTTVLLTGESGTGKGLLARQLHDMSARRQHPFVSVDCSTLVPTLFESELFGHVKGSFTGAGVNRIGKFELAKNGSLFFDEVGNISLEIQAKLLKAVEDRAICQVGGNRIIRVDTRLIAATNQDLSQAVARGAFRQDLFYRLNVVHIHLPPLRERVEDVPLLAEHFLERFRYPTGLKVRGFTTQALDRLRQHHWPGNVRELANMVQRLVVLATGPYIDAEDIQNLGALTPAQPDDEALTLAQVERRHILGALRRLGGHKGRAAQELGIDRKTLRLKIKKYHLEMEVEGLSRA